MSEYIALKKKNRYPQLTVSEVTLIARKADLWQFWHTLLCDSFRLLQEKRLPLNYLVSKLVFAGSPTLIIVKFIQVATGWTYTEARDFLMQHQALRPADTLTVR